MNKDDTILVSIYLGGTVILMVAFIFLIKGIEYYG
jgi:hypothetical protein